MYIRRVRTLLQIFAELSIWVTASREWLWFSELDYSAGLGLYTKDSACLFSGYMLNLSAFGRKFHIPSINTAVCNPFIFLPLHILWVNNKASNRRVEESGQKCMHWVRFKPTISVLMLYHPMCRPMFMLRWRDGISTPPFCFKERDVMGG
jgi:hypothetical protein